MSFNRTNRIVKTSTFNAKISCDEVRFCDIPPKSCLVFQTAHLCLIHKNPLDFQLISVHNVCNRYPPKSYDGG